MNYFENIAKEINDAYQSQRRTSDMSNQVGPGTDAEANRLRGIQDRQAGQLVGAVLQGRRYDRQGKQIKK